MTGSEVPPSFRLAYVPGVTPTKWVRIWNERLPEVPLTLVAVSPAEAFEVLRGGGADAGFVRLPVDGTDLSAIPLYTETTVVVIPKDHILAAVDEVSEDDLADDIVLHPLDETLSWEHRPGLAANERPATTADAVELVAAGVGLLLVPQSLARLHHRKDLTYRPVPEAPSHASRCRGHRTRRLIWWTSSSGSSAGARSTAHGDALPPPHSPNRPSRPSRPSDPIQLVRAGNPPPASRRARTHGAVPEAPKARSAVSLAAGPR